MKSAMESGDGHAPTHPSPSPWRIEVNWAASRHRSVRPDRLPSGVGPGASPRSVPRDGHPRGRYCRRHVGGDHDDYWNGNEESVMGEVTNRLLAAMNAHDLD